MKETSTDIHSDLRSQVSAFATQAIEDDSFFLVDVVLRGQKGSRVIDVYFDGDNGIGLDDLSRISRQLGFLIETADIVRGRYHLNVSSPGPDRAFHLRRQYAKHVGKKLSIHLASNPASDEASSGRTVEGELVSCSDDLLELQISNTKILTIDFEEVAQAQVMLPW